MILIATAELTAELRLPARVWAYDVYDRGWMMFMQGLTLCVARRSQLYQTTNHTQYNHTKENTI